MIVLPESAPCHRAGDGTETRHLSDAGRLTQFGAYVETLPSGALSSQRHWHDCEDEFLYVLEGAATVIDDDGDHLLQPGDAACWRHGDPNAHHVANRGVAALRYLIVGSRVAGDICRYPDSGRSQINGDTRWRMTGPDGSILREGDLPDHLRNLPAVWGKPHDGSPARRIVRAGEAPLDRAPADDPLGAFEARLISRAGGLSQFGAFVETLAPGSFSSHRHWHECEDEFLFVLDGEATVIEDDGPHRLGPGGCACWPAGVANAHHVQNRSAAPCTYLVVGTRWPHDRVHYAEADRFYARAADGTETRTRRDGSPL